MTEVLEAHLILPCHNVSRIGNSQQFIDMKSHKIHTHTIHLFFKNE